MGRPAACVKLWPPAGPRVKVSNFAGPRVKVSNFGRPWGPYYPAPFPPAPAPPAIALSAVCANACRSPPGPFSYWPQPQPRPLHQAPCTANGPTTPISNRISCCELRSPALPRRPSNTWPWLSRSASPPHASITHHQPDTPKLIALATSTAHSPVRFNGSPLSAIDPAPLNGSHTTG